MPEPQSPAVLKALALLVPLEAEQKRLGRTMLEGAGGSLFPLDLLAIAAVNRSMSNIAGFRQMIESRNYLCAGALLRLQLDTAMRFAAASLAPDPHHLATEVLRGKAIRRLKDRHGRQMTDAYLVEVLANKDPWVARVYERTSGYIHLSDKHIFNSVTSVSKDRIIAFKMSPEDAAVPDGLYVEAVEAFGAATSVFLGYLEGWVVTKSHPELLPGKTPPTDSTTGL
jgi:hypothetical protein